jgi:hypothetical protein
MYSMWADPDSTTEPTYDSMHATGQAPAHIVSGPHRPNQHRQRTLFFHESPVGSTTRSPSQHLFLYMHTRTSSYQGLNPSTLNTQKMSTDSDSSSTSGQTVTQTSAKVKPRACHWQLRSAIVYHQKIELYRLQAPSINAPLLDLAILALPFLRTF